VRKKEHNAAKKAKEKETKDKKQEKSWARGREIERKRICGTSLWDLSLKVLLPLGMVEYEEMRRDLYVSGTLNSLITDRIIVHVKSEVFNFFPLADLLAIVPDLIQMS
jgi:hypothetical protein